MVSDRNPLTLTQKIILIITLIIGTFFLSLPVIRSGLPTPWGIGFWGPTGHDFIWHLNLISHIDSPFSVPLASFAGETLKNYHPFYNLLIAFIKSLTRIPATILIFQIFPILSSLLLLFLVYQIGLKITHKFVGGIILMLLNVFASSFGFLVTLINQGKLGGESLFWSMQSASVQINPPLVLSFIFISCLLLIILSKRHLYWAIILLALLPVTKVYGGVAGYLLWGFFSLRELTLKNFRPLIILLLSLTPSILLFGLYNSTSTGLVEFNPFWFIDQLFSSPDKFYLPRLASALINYRLSGNLLALPLYLVGALIFLAGNFGFRLLGLLSVRRQDFPHFILYSLIILALLPLIVVQKGTAWNTIQFFYYALFLANILLSLTLVSLPQKLFWPITTVLLFLSVISNYDNYRGSLGNPPPAAIPYSEVEALNFLKLQPPGTVLTAPYDDHLRDSFDRTPLPLYAYITSAYVSAYTPHSVFIADEMNLNNSAYDWQNRLKQSSDFFLQLNQYQDRGFLVNNHIDYIYLTGLEKDRFLLDLHNLSLVPIFQNDSTVIYRVNR